ncbi:Rv1733c family protein [Streptomyces fagopyri]|uniref:Rv1733c family protein n=1 Tax=Streptomyces fagopyri TaxID=2662397 RepID=UPI0037FCA5BA
MAGGTPETQSPAEEPPPEDLPRVMLWRLRRSPLRRRNDLLQAWIGIGLLAAVLAAAPAAMFLAGDTAYRHYSRTAERQHQAREPGVAVLLQDVPRHPEPGSTEDKESRYPVRVRFTDPTGHTRIAKTGVRPGLTEGSTIRIWSDTQGRLTGPPLTTDQIRSRCMGWAITAAVAVTTLGGIAYGTTDLVLRRHNLAAWDTAWARTAPRWTAST